MLNRNLWYGITGIMIIFGIIGIGNIFIHGEHVMGTSNYVPWGSLIGAYVFFVAISTGLTFLSSMVHVFKMKQFEFLTKRLTLASIATLLMGFVMIGVELGNPLAMVYILVTPNVMAPIFWMGAFYGLYLVLHIIEFFFQIKDNHKIVNTISPFVLVVGIAAQSTLGAVFGLSVARGIWNSAYLSIFFLIMAFVSGLAVAMIMAFFLSKGNVMKQEDREKLPGLYPFMSKLTMGLLAVGIIFVTWNWIYGLHSGNPNRMASMELMLNGPLAVPYWVLEVGFVFLIPLLILGLVKAKKAATMLTTGVVLLIGLFAMRIILTFAGQMVPLEVVTGSLTMNELRDVSILWSEWATMIFGVGGSILIYMLGERFLNLDVTEHGSHGTHDKKATQAS
ncbi:respiratory selenite reductase subunit SrrC [Salisediminibacterium selenitireducens]|uniref:Polysulphide reductase NrfD n=1 Tax=Bacillus selenitireducens (strain ATCC 700615 / DSM 15326 / MLS10) TaxID=439292 RepID=D6XT54_BACIE|nr:respiratory selenite reductase subunit SrrC [Salisediminibacterium selenitireducens]ADH98990.1 Polysulphide reductase NrfD [[Bacillus] selenitireducens MLS10]